MPTFAIHRDPITDLALPHELDRQLCDALNSGDPDHSALVAQAVESAVNTQLAASGWDGNWSAADIVTAILSVADEATVLEEEIAELETQPCGSCAAAASLDATDVATVTLSHRMPEGYEYDHGDLQSTLLRLAGPDGTTLIERSYLLPADPRDDGVQYWRAFAAATTYLAAWLTLHGIIDPTVTSGADWEITFPRAAWH